METIIYRIGIPLLTVLTVVLGPFLNLELQRLLDRYPNWTGLIEFWRDYDIVVFLFFAIALLLITILQKVREPDGFALRSNNEKLRNQVKSFSENIWAVFDGQMLSYAEKLGFSADSQSRLSIYVHNSDTEQFIPCGRYSPNPMFRKKGRTFYPDNVGGISIGWQQAWHFDNQYPEDIKKHEEYCNEKAGLAPSVHAMLTMKSRLYAFYRIETEDRQLGVAVYESMDKEAFEEEELKELMQDIGKNFARLILDVEQYIPQPETAREIGL